LTIDDLRSGFAEPPPSAAPMMRWWWFGPSVSRPELERELTAMAAAGISGVEVAYVYPLATATTEFGSDAFSPTCASLRSERTSSGSAST
jgi:hypothetical protein